MNYQLKLKDGSKVNLSFSMYFLNRACKLAGKSLQEIFGYLTGEIEKGSGHVVRGGLFDDLEVRAVVLAAGLEASNFANGDYEIKTLVDGFRLMEEVENSLTTSAWGDMFVILCESLVANKLPKDDAPKKKAVQKKAKK